MLRVIDAFHVARLCTSARVIGISYSHTGGCQGGEFYVACRGVNSTGTPGGEFYVACRGCEFYVACRGVNSTWHTWSHLPASP